MTTIFVYGTLKRGYSNHHLLEKSKNNIFLGEAETLKKFKMISFVHFPGVLDTSQETTIKGELYNVDLQTLKKLDILEGYPDFYTKKIIKVKLDDKIIKAYMYILNTTYRAYDTYENIPSGDFSDIKKPMFNSKFLQNA